jgi:hypothetical protein
MNTDKIKELERKVTELKQSIPPHSVKPEMLVKLEELEEELQKEKSKGERISFGSYAVVACGTLAPEINYLKKSGFLDAREILFTKPGRHEKIIESWKVI